MIIKLLPIKPTPYLYQIGLYLTLVFTLPILGNSQSMLFRPYLEKGNGEVPTKRSLIWDKTSAFATKSRLAWASRELKNQMGKGDMPHTLLAKLFLHQDIQQVNEHLMQNTAWGVTGSSWAMNKKGDYDFTMTIYMTILYYFGDQPTLLYPSTTQHLLAILLTEEGNHFRYKAPKTLGLFPETENHLLMTEGSRYLKNRWLQLHGDSRKKFDNVKNGMEKKLVALLKVLYGAGLYEYNSLPYTGYTITALLNLEAFGSEVIKQEARNVLDYMNWCYALGTYQFKHYPSMRRRYEKSVVKELTTDYHSLFMKAWCSFLPNASMNIATDYNNVHSFMGVMLPYRPADKVIELISEKKEGYFVQLGHGPNSCPEIFTAGKNYLLSAGGSNQGKWSQILPRPTVLFLNDSAKQLKEAFHIFGPGDNYMFWNNTGVYKNFACAAGPVLVPSNQKPVFEKDNWKIYAYTNQQFIVTYSTADCGLICLLEANSIEIVAANLLKNNADPSVLKNKFTFPDGQEIEYDLLAPKNRWVIKSWNGLPLDRVFSHWPLIHEDDK